ATPNSSATRRSGSASRVSTKPSALSRVSSADDVIAQPLVDESILPAIDQRDINVGDLSACDLLRQRSNFFAADRFARIGRALGILSDDRTVRHTLFYRVWDGLWRGLIHRQFPGFAHQQPDRGLRFRKYRAPGLPFRSNCSSDVSPDGKNSSARGDGVHSLRATVRGVAV